MADDPTAGMPPSGSKSDDRLMQLVNATKEHAAAVLANTKAVEANTKAHVMTQEMLGRLLNPQAGGWLDTMVRHFTELKQRLAALTNALGRRL